MYRKYLDLIAMSRDSFDPETNLKQGRAENGTAATQVAEWAKDMGIKVKISISVVIRLRLKVIQLGWLAIVGKRV